MHGLFDRRCVQESLCRETRRVDCARAEEHHAAERRERLSVGAHLSTGTQALWFGEHALVCACGKEPIGERLWHEESVGWLLHPRALLLL